MSGRLSANWRHLSFDQELSAASRLKSVFGALKLMQKAYHAAKYSASIRSSKYYVLGGFVVGQYVTKYDLIRTKNVCCG
jgi:hypothetical protein